MKSVFGDLKPLAISGGHFGIIPASKRHRALDNKGTPAVRLGAILEKLQSEHARGTPFSPVDLRRIFRRFRENGGCVRRFSPRLSTMVHDLADALTLEAAQDPDGQLRLSLLDDLPQACRHLTTRIPRPGIRTVKRYRRSRSEQPAPSSSSARH